MSTGKSDSPELERIWNEIKRLNDRLDVIEASLLPQNERKANDVASYDEADFEFKIPFRSKGSIEYSVGEYGMAWLGNIVLLFGIIFLFQYVKNSGHILLSFVAGFIAVAGIYTVTYLTKKSYSYLSGLLSYTGHLLLFYFTVRLHFFGPGAPIENRVAGLAILFLVIAVLFLLAYKRQSQLMSFMVLCMLLVTGIIGNYMGFTASIATLVSAISVFLYFKFNWTKIHVIFIFLSYITHLLWLLNNPFMGNNLEFVSSPGISIVAVFLTGLLYSLVAFSNYKENISNEYVIATIIFNGLGFTVLLLISTFNYYLNNYELLYGTIAVFCMGFSVILKRKSTHQIIASIYALYGFLALSVSLYGIFLFPKAYMLFALQSLLVVSFALWYRSKFMVIMNSILFLLLMIFFLREKSGSIGSYFTYVIVAFISARFINWKKERFNIRTEYVRNLYLVCGFIMTLISFYKAFPESYVTVSWIFAAIIFFLFGYLIKNIKYRWLAIASVIAAAIKLVFFDMSDIEVGYRVLVFLLLAALSIAVSIFYTRYLDKKKTQI